jgi:hypothetical protein
MKTIRDIERQIAVMEKCFSEMESQLTKVMTPSLRYELLQRIEELKDSIDLLRHNLDSHVIEHADSLTR